MSHEFVWGHGWAIAPQHIEQFRIVLSIFRISAPTILRDFPTMCGAMRNRTGRAAGRGTAKETASPMLMMMVVMDTAQRGFTSSVLLSLIHI